MDRTEYEAKRNVTDFVAAIGLLGRIDGFRLEHMVALLERDEFVNPGPDGQVACECIGEALLSVVTENKRRIIDLARHIALVELGEISGIAAGCLEENKEANE